MMSGFLAEVQQGCHCLKLGVRERKLKMLPGTVHPPSYVKKKNNKTILSYNRALEKERQTFLPSLKRDVIFREGCLTRARLP